MTEVGEVLYIRERYYGGSRSPALPGAFMPSPAYLGMIGDGIRIAVGRAPSLCIVFAGRGLPVRRVCQSLVSQDGMICSRRTSPAPAKHGACPGGLSLSAGTERACEISVAHPSLPSQSPAGPACATCFNSWPMRPPRIHRSRKGNNSHPTFCVPRASASPWPWFLVDGMRLTHRRT